ncbi:MAG TPA: beta-ketoacyl synthase N-terminal-like domain-containing protein [Actinophytocola sp.]|uniref:beta-ketoacyl-[acyl-carrier-protein] synthase family protein n=1 Tax=Actinophytocola sp. TaxID=1872138 RepID=UPI002DBA92C8|nr:beta-ketoacyl synthase N-terminal-like domain-containing protein [Actinophytocola sp.]HEU5469109.1 beta-ketoacyl synthase N-terminal-like domain-containing protein [Actinophytocola sp.]
MASALGRGTEAQLAGTLAGVAAFAPVTRFDVAGHRVRVAATLPDAGSLTDELATAIDEACGSAGLSGAHRAACPLVLAVHAFPNAPRVSADRWRTATELAELLAIRVGLGPVARVYTSACVSASTALADAAALISSGRADRIVVAGGYLVEPDQFALFDAGRALATDGAVRPFSTGRTGLLLGDAVAAVVLESATGGRRRTGSPLARLTGWGRAGDAFHAVQPHPQGQGLAKAIGAALRRARIGPGALGYINAHGTGTPFSDAAEAAGLRQALGPAAAHVPLSSTKATHGHTLEASGLIELGITVLAMRAGKLPVNAGFLAADEACPLNVVHAGPRSVNSEWALSVNAAFGGACTALVVRVT